MRQSGLLLIAGVFLVFLVGSFLGPAGQKLSFRPKADRAFSKWTWAAFSRAKLEAQPDGSYRWPGTGQVVVNPAWQKKADGLLSRFAPPYGALLVQDMADGQILAASGFSKREPFQGHSFQHPFLGRRVVAASLVKTPVAAVLMEREIAGPASMAPCTAVFKTQGCEVENALRRDRGQITLALTLATSCNTTMARYSQKLGWSPILEMLDRVGWLAPAYGLPKTVPGKAPTDAEDCVLAESASGYGHVELTPWHMLGLQSTLAGDGQPKAPNFIRFKSDLKANEPANQKALADCGTACNFSPPRVWTIGLAKSLKSAHKGTVHDAMGTGHRAFFRGGRYRLPEGVTVYGKTGSLTNPDPNGFLTWFGAVVERPGKSPLAVVSIVINDPVWHIKASGLMAELLVGML